MTSRMSIVEADLVVQERNDNDKKDEKKQRLQFDFDFLNPANAIMIRV